MKVDAKQAIQLCGAIEQNISRVIVGKGSVIHLLMIALAAQGHVLLEDVPGIGKTTIVSALARSLNLSFRRIQFTPDVMPSDITGYNMYNQKTGEFEFQAGSIMSQLILADEINRTSPKTQSSLLEAMQEQQVTVDGVSYVLPKPFMVLATQNPIEQVGTYALPEAQLDRFMLKVSFGYPDLAEEMQILSRFSEKDPLQDLQPVASANDVLWLVNQARHVFVSEPIKRYIALIAQATRESRDLLVGMSPRASLMLLQAAKANALLSGRDYVIPDDVQFLLRPALAHRLLLQPESKLKQRTAESVLTGILHATKVPEN